ncbi:hypothetical protein L0337_13035 [candidate division KSB1 bacterium]|nr:hypothetical protein [candidate division KSB1 bacterium]
MNFAAEADKEHDNLKEYSKTRFSELVEIFSEENKAAVNYEKLLCRATLILGHVKPKDAADQAIRDLLADVFDFLHISRQLILQGNLSAAFPLLRRAFESSALIHYFILKPLKADNWSNGKQIENREVRKFLGSNRIGLTAAEDAYKKAYDDYSGGSHPNRKYVPYRYLGEPNEFVLGSVVKPELLIVGINFSKLIGLWFWLAAMISMHYFKLFEIADPTYSRDYMKVADFAQKIADVLQNKCVKWSKEYDAQHQNDANVMVNS